MNSDVLTLLLVYQLKHFLADYPLQGGFMLKKFLPGWDFVLPLMAHCGVHALMTLAIVMFFNPALWWLALVDFGVHFVMDRLKAGPKYLGRFKALSGNEFKNILSYKDTVGLEQFKPQIRGNTFFWWSLGLDQMVHHLTHYFIIWKLLS